MMTDEEKLFIQYFQQKFEQTFGKELKIDWDAMMGGPSKKVPSRVNNVTDTTISEKFNKHNNLTLERALMDCITRHNADITKIRDRSARLHKSGYTNERNAMIDFVEIVFKNDVNPMDAAKLINRDRSVLYHYRKLKPSQINL